MTWKAEKQYLRVPHTTAASPEREAVILALKLLLYSIGILQARMKLESFGEEVLDKCTTEKHYSQGQGRTGQTQPPPPREAKDNCSTPSRHRSARAEALLDTRLFIPLETWRLLRNYHLRCVCSDMYTQSGNV